MTNEFSLILWIFDININIVDYEEMREIERSPSLHWLTTYSEKDIAEEDKKNQINLFLKSLFL